MPVPGEPRTGLNKRNGYIATSCAPAKGIKTNPLNHGCGVEVWRGVFIEPLQAVGYVESSGVVEAVRGQDNLDHFDEVPIKPRLLM